MSSLSNASPDDVDLNVVLMEDSPWTAGDRIRERFKYMFKHTIRHFARGYEMQNFARFVGGVFLIDYENT